MSFIPEKTVAVDKKELYDTFRRRLRDPNDPDAPYRSVYWSPSGGTTGESLHVPVDDAENNLQRASLVPLLLAGRVYGQQTIDANLFDTGRGGYLYRAQEIFKDFVAQCHGTSLPLGWTCPDQLVVQRCQDFRANSISASPSRMASLAGYVLSRLNALQQETSSSESAQEELRALNDFRHRVTRGVYACEPLHDARMELIRSAFPRMEFASVLGGAEVGCWGVCLPAVMPNGAFLYDKRVVTVRAINSSVSAVDAAATSRRSVGHLIVTNHLRERFPVKNYDTGDIGSVVPAHCVCTNDNLLKIVEKSVLDGMQMREWCCQHGQLAAPQPLLGAVVLESRAASLAGEQLNVCTHTLNASELVQKATSFVREAQDGNQPLGAFVNGQVVVWFNRDGEGKLEERVDVRVVFSEMEDRFLVKKISAIATVSMRDWIMSTLSKKELAEAISVSITPRLETTDTASNQNKLPLCRDLRGRNGDRKAMAQSVRETAAPITSGDDASDSGGGGFGISPCLERTTATSDRCCDSSLAASTDGLHPRSVWIGAYQASPSPLWDLPSSTTQLAHEDLEQELRRVVPLKLLERVPPSTWAPYPFAMTLPLYDATIELSANLRRAVKALVSSRGLALLRAYYKDEGVAGGLAVPVQVSGMLFDGDGEASVPSAPPIVEPAPLGERNVSEFSKVSSIDLGWSRTLLERDLSGFSRASSSRVCEQGIESVDEKQVHKAEQPIDDEEDKEDEDDEEDEFDPISHLGIVDESCSSGSSDLFAAGNRKFDKIENSDSVLSRGLVFWRPDFLFDLAKVNRCASCSLGMAGDAVHSERDCSTSERPWPPTSKETSRTVGKRSSAMPPVSVCEINARFTMNAFAMSAFGVDAARRMLLRKGQFENDQDAINEVNVSVSPWSEFELAPVHRLIVMKEEIRKRIASPTGCPIWLVKGREKGYDCHAMGELMDISPVLEVTPSDLPALLDEWFLGEGTTPTAETVCGCPNCPNGTVGASIDSFECESVCLSHRGGSSCTLLIFLELHQDEIVSLPPSTLRYLTGSVPATRNCCCRSPIRVLTCNPLPALFLLHDKRTLAVLGDQKLMKGLVGSRAARILAGTIVSTVPISDLVRAASWETHTKVRSAAREFFSKDMNPFKLKTSSSPSSWDEPPSWMLDVFLKAVCDQSCFVMKRAQSGKGAGMIYGEEVSRSTWFETLFMSSSGSYVLQPKIEQATFPCVLSAESTSSTQSDDVGCAKPLSKPRVCHVVGCMPFLGEVSFGPGIFRASTAGPHPVSVTGGGAILLPALKMVDNSVAQQAPRWLIRSGRSLLSPCDEKQQEHKILATLRRSFATWNCCGDCALRDQTIRASVSDAFKEYCSSVLFYSGVSVLACREPEIVSQFRNMESRKSLCKRNPWIMVSVLPTTADLGQATELLSRYGVCVWRANNEMAHEKSSLVDSPIVNEALVLVVHQLGGNIKTHCPSSSDGRGGEESVWDISPRCLTPARSHNAQAFPMHTDASFEHDPPTHFLLHVLSHDVLGGGLSRLLGGRILLRVLSPGMRSLLSRQDFLFQIPAEFRKESGEGSRPKVVKQSILMTPSYRWRFRSDIVSGPYAPHAVRQLEDLLRTPSLSIRTRLVPGSVLLLDNGRFFHSRSRVLDTSRWLKRVRFSLDES